MIAVDTNVLIRILVEDPGAVLQMQSARALLAKSSEAAFPHRSEGTINVSSTKGTNSYAAHTPIVRS